MIEYNISEPDYQLAALDDHEKIALLRSIWMEDHVLGFESLFGVKLDDQQKSLIRAAQKPHCRVAVKSGTGCGKTFCLAGLTFLYLILYKDVRILATSPSYTQLSRVYRTELDKLYGMMNEHFKPFFAKGMFKERIGIEGLNDQRVVDLVTANPANPTSLQGGHSTVYIILVDEASGVEDGVWEILIRTLTGEHTKVIATSNPTKNAGFYYDIFNKELKNWDRITFNGFDSAHVTESWIQEMADTFGKESDTYTIAVLGNFGRIGESSFFSAHIVEASFTRRAHLSEYQHYPKITGVDVAGSGPDSTVFLTRQGPSVIDIERHKGLDPMEVVAALVEYRRKMMPHYIYVDATGIGSGVGPRARELGIPAQDVLVVRASPNPNAYFNLRAWLYGEVRNWLATGGSLPYDEELRKDLMNCLYTHSGKLAIQIYPKHVMRAKGYPSPDALDALALTMMDNIYSATMAVVKPREIIGSKFLWA